jgi:Domain of unknown function (DUF4249)
MKKTISIISSMIIILLTQSCSYDDTLSLEIKENKLVLNAVLVANENPVVYVGKIFSPTDNVPNNHYVMDAEVLLFENNNLVGSLKYQQSGVYTLPNVKLKVGNSYFFKVKSQGYSDTYNRPVLIPKNVESNSVTFDNETAYPSPDAGFNSNSNDYKYRLLSIKLSDNINEKYYGVGMKGTKGGNNVSGGTYPVEVDRSNFYKLNTDCYKSISLIEDFSYDLTQKPYIPLILYSASCFGKEKTMGVVISTYGTVQTPNLNDVYNSTIDRLEATIVTLSEEYFNYAKNVKVIEGIDNAFFEPKPVYTNIVNGYGVVVAINKKVVVFNL